MSVDELIDWMDISCGCDMFLILQELQFNIYYFVLKKGWFFSHPFSLYIIYIKTLYIIVA
jgi:hypothetical protein